MEEYYDAFKKAGFTNRKSIASLKKNHLEKMRITNEIHADILLDNAPLKENPSSGKSTYNDLSNVFDV